MVCVTKRMCFEEHMRMDMNMGVSNRIKAQTKRDLGASVESAV